MTKETTPMSSVSRIRRGFQDNPHRTKKFWQETHPILCCPDGRRTVRTHEIITTEDEWATSQEFLDPRWVVNHLMLDCGTYVHAIRAHWPKWIDDESDLLDHPTTKDPRAVWEHDEWEVPGPDGGKLRVELVVTTPFDWRYFDEREDPRWSIHERLDCGLLEALRVVPIA
jgi:hypothetical protein